MFINHEYKFIFIHIPKNAGTSIRNSFDINGYDKKVVRRRYPHYSCSVIKKYCGDTTWNNFYTFSVVRNPYDRMVSYYHYHKSNQYRHKSTAREYDFSEWLVKGLDSNLKKTQSEYLDVDINHVMRYESLQDDFNLVCDNIEIPRYELPKYNTSNHLNFAVYYGEKEKDIVKGIFEEDFYRFGYEF